MALKPSDFHVLLAVAGRPAARVRHHEARRERFGGSVRLEIGSLYRLLGRLLDSGLIEEGAGDERRRCRQLSLAGRRALKAEAERLAGLVDLVRMRKLLPEAD